MNNGYYCNSPKVLVLDDNWPQKEAFLGTLRGVLAALPPNPPYYPGSHQRYKGLVDAYAAEQVETIKGPGFGKRTTQYGEEIPWTLIHTTADASNLNASKNEYAFRNEPFCPVLTICLLKGVSGPAQYLDAATALANQCMWGRLSASLIVHPTTEKEEAAALDKAVASLEYGTIVVNGWSGLGYPYENGVWGGYAGGSPQPLETIENVESGLGFVNNCLAFDHVEKSVVRGPFIDPDVQLGTGGMLTRKQAVNLTNLFINPGLKALLRFLCPCLCGCL